MRVRRFPRRLTAAATIIALAMVLTGCDDPPTTVTTSVDYDCEINPNHFLLGGAFSDSMTSTYDTTAPQAVKPNGEFVVTVAPEPFTVNASNDWGTVSHLSNMVWRVAVPANASLVSQSIAGWSNVGAGTPTSTSDGSTIVITIPGPIAAGVEATLPTLTMNLQATGGLGSRIEPTVAGTSYASNGLSFTTTVTNVPFIGTINPTFRCFPSPSPALHSTLISEDTLAPKITITSPVADQAIVQGTTVLADYSCDDGGGVGVASCVGTVADGAAIDTSTLGAHTFTVTATDDEGKVGTKSVTYTVTAP